MREKERSLMGGVINADDQAKGDAVGEKYL